MIQVTFLDMTVEINKALLSESEFDIDFNGQMLVRFENNSDDKFQKFVAINAMNGYGQNIRDEVFGKELIIEDC